MNQSSSCELVSILSDLIGDLATAVTVLKDYSSNEEFYELQHAHFRRGVFQLCLASIVLSLCKFEEACQHYGCLMNQSLSKPTKQMKNELVKKINERERIRALRNTYIGHVRDRGSQKAHGAKEVQSLIVDVVGGDSHEDVLTFLDWICADPPNSSLASVSVTLCITTMRDELRKV